MGEGGSYYTRIANGNRSKQAVLLQADAEALTSDAATI
jgi:hypothetical protein